MRPLPKVDVTALQSQLTFNHLQIKQLFTAYRDFWFRVEPECFGAVTGSFTAAKYCYREYLILGLHSRQLKT